MQIFSVPLSCFKDRNLGLSMSDTPWTSQNLFIFVLGEFLLQSGISVRMNKKNPLRTHLWRYLNVQERIVRIQIVSQTLSSWL